MPLTILMYSMVNVPHIMVGLERMFDYRGVGLARFHCMYFTSLYVCHVRYDAILSCDLHLLSCIAARN